jgi:hypothetical protein
VVAVTILPKRRHKPPVKRRRRQPRVESDRGQWHPRRSEEQVAKDVVTLCEYYGTPRTDRGLADALMFAVTHGRVRIPAKAHPRRRGPRSIWRGQMGLGLVTEVEKELQAGKTVTEAIEILQNRETRRRDSKDLTRRWDSDDFPDLEKRYYEAKRYWDEVRKRIAEGLFAWANSSPRD